MEQIIEQINHETSSSWVTKQRTSRINELVDSLFNLYNNTPIKNTKIKISNDYQYIYFKYKQYTVYRADIYGFLNKEYMLGKINFIKDAIGYSIHCIDTK
jgi:hypothetical protein